MDWFRSWHGAPTDPKWLVIARRSNTSPGMVSALAWALLDYASQHASRGSIDGFDVETYAAFTGWDEDQIETILDAMRGKGIITEDNRLASWEKRQPKREDPGSSDRVTEWRKRQRDNALQERNNSVTTEDVTRCNAPKRIVTPDEIQRDENREDENRVCAPAAPEHTPAYPAGFDEFERTFKINLITAVQERDPGQRFVSGFSLADTSKAALLQLMSGGPVLSAKAIDWALDQWEETKRNERFDARNTGCVNWLLATVNNSYKPGKNGHDPAKRGSAKTTSAELDAIFGVDIHGNPV